MTVTGGNVGTSDHGGGILNHGTLTITDVDITGNIGGVGSGIYSTGGTLSIVRSNITSNTAHSTNGVVVESAEELAIQSSAIDHNWGGIGDSGVVVLNTPTVSIKDTTVAENRAGYGFAGLRINGSSIVRISNSTFSDNWGGYSGGGVYVDAVDAVLTNLTVVRNRGTFGGGVSASGSVELHSSIVAQNYIGSASTFSSDLTGTFSIGSSHNLIGNDSNTTNNIDNDPNNGFFNQVGGQGGSALLDPLLGRLRYNGGLTRTHALLSGSLAIDRGSNFEAAGVTYDQRGEGFDRVLNGGFSNTVDIGAIEMAMEELVV